LIEFIIFNKINDWIRW